MKICLITAFPPSKRGLAEYGYHLARELQRDPLMSVTVVADQVDEPSPDMPGFEVMRNWKYNSFANPTRLLSLVRDIKPDVVWFNLLYSTFGDQPVQAFLGLGIPAMMRMAGFYTHVTLHHLMENMRLEDSNVTMPRLYRMAGSVATRMLLASHSVSVLLPAYRRTLMEKYNGENVHFRAHGILSARPEYPDLSLRGNPHKIIAFGKWGTYKRPETLIEAFARIREKLPAGAKLVIAGGDNPLAAGYIDALREKFGNSSIEFPGYLAEEQIPALFRDASLMVMPYTSATGSSGVAHLACEYGVPVVCSDIPDFREMAEDEGLAVDFYEPGNTDALADSMLALLQSPQRLREMAEQNFAAALRMTMPQIIRQYLRAFTLHQKRKALDPIARFRRLPNWVPSRSRLYRAASPRWASWM
jgi:glycosyltransferase involved in cell wall biosynthesis